MDDAVVWLDYHKDEIEKRDEKIAFLIYERDQYRLALERIAGMWADTDSNIDGMMVDIAEQALGR